MRALRFRVGIALALATAAAMSCAPETVPLTPSPRASAAATSSVTASASPGSPTPGPLLEVLPGLRLAAVRTIPRDFLYARVISNGIEHIYLLDLSGAREPAEVAQRDVPGLGAAVGLLQLSAVTPDGELLLLASTPPGPQRTYAIRPATGDAMLVLEQADAQEPVLSPDGRWFAFTRFTQSIGTNGVWVEAIAGGAPRLLVTEDPSWNGSPPRAMFWASERLVAVNASVGEASSLVAVVDVDAAVVTFDATRAMFSGSARLLGPAFGADPSRGDADLLLWYTVTPFGGRTSVTAYDVQSGRSRQLYVPAAQVGLNGARWHPDGTRIATIEGLFPGGGVTSLWVRQSDGVATRQLEDSDLAAAWWSRDGRALFAQLTSHVGARTIRIDDLTNHRTVATLCEQGAGRACAAVTPTPTPKPTPAPLAGPIPWRAIGGVEACGTVRSFAAPTSSAAGQLSIGSRTFGLAPGYGYRGTGFVPTSGMDMCVWGGLGDPSGVESGAGPLDHSTCGYVVDRPAPDRLVLMTRRDRGLLTLTVAATAGIAADISRTHLRCFDVAVDPSGDAQLIGRTPSSTLTSREEVGCGTVKLYVPPTVSSAGSISLGSRTYPIRAGVSYSGDPAGQRIDPVRPGVALCLNAVIEDDETISAHGPDRVLGTAGSLECGQVVIYRAPTTSTPGEVRLYVGSSTKAIPIGVDVLDDSPSYRCFALELDARGDLVVARRTDRLPPVATSTPWPTHAP